MLPLLVVFFSVPDTAGCKAEEDLSDYNLSTQ